MSDPLLTARSISKVYGTAAVLKNVDLELRPGEIHAIIGENGAGKSTLAKIAAGVVQPTGGEILLSGRTVHFANPRQALNDGISLIHQEPLTFPNLSIAENVFVGNQPGKGRVDWKKMEALAAQLFCDLGVKLDPRVTAGSLSIAGQQMIELASALSHEARVIICDETTASLTPKEVDELFTILRALRDQGKAIAFVSHRLNEIIEISDRVTILRDGEKVGEKNTSETTVTEIVQLMVGREIQTAFQKSSGQTEGPTILEVQGLTLPGKFQDISFGARAGEVLGLAGLVGAGRTEICEAIFGVTPAKTGTISFMGQRVKIGKPADAIKLGIAMVPEDRQHHGLHTAFTIRENEVMAALSGVSRRGWLNPANERKTTLEAIKQTRVACRGPEQTISELSGGNQQKISFSKWLEVKPRLLILDEPTRGVDIGAKESIHRMIRELAESEHLAVLMVSSDMNEVLGLSDRILIIREGRIAGEFEGSTAGADEIMFAATGQVKNAS